jgi:hypothetical protein
MSGVEWINLAEDRDEWRVLVNTVMKYQVQLNVGKFEASQEGQLHGVS